MPNTYIPVEMDIGSDRIVIINIRSDVVDYFGIETSTTVENIEFTKKRKSHTRRGSGKLIRIPTKLVTEKNNIRTKSPTCKQGNCVCIFLFFIFLPTLI